MNEIHKFSDVAMDVIENIENWIQYRKNGFPTGFSNLDKIIGGVKASELTLVAADHRETGSIFAMKIISHLCVKLQCSVGVFKTPSPLEKYALELICSICEMDPESVFKGYLDRESSRKFYQAAKSLLHSRLYLSHGHRLPISEIPSACRRMKEDYNVDLIVMDNISCVGTHFEPSTSTHKILTDLKSVAKEFDISVIAIAVNHSLSTDPQLSRLSRNIQLVDEFGREADAIWLLEPRTLPPRDALTREDECEEVDLSIIPAQAGGSEALRFEFNRKKLRFQECD